MRRAIVVPIDKALASLRARVLASRGPVATQLMCATALVLHCMRPSSTHGLRGSVEALAFRGGHLVLSLLRGPPTRLRLLRGRRMPACQVLFGHLPRLRWDSLCVGTIAVPGPWIS